MPQCKAKSKRSQVQCKNRAMVDRTVCRMHGGKNKRGINHYAVKRAKSKVPSKYSEHIDTDLDGRYLRALNDPQLLSLRDDIALFEARMTQLIERVDSGESRELWTRASKYLKAFHDAKKIPDAREASIAMKEAMSGLRLVINRGLEDYYIWDDIMKTYNMKERAVNSEHKRGVEMGNMITAHQAIALITTVMNIVSKNVTDPDAITSIQDGIKAVAQTMLNPDMVDDDDIEEGEFEDIID